jgi:hypothetical protein
MDVNESSFLAPKYKDKIIFVVMLIVIITIIIDTSIIKTYDLVSKKKSLGWMIPVFAILVSIVAVAQYFVLGFVKNKIKSVVLGKRFHLNSIRKMVTAFQYALLLLLVMVVLQIVVLSYYKTIILVAITSISYALTIGMMAMLATRFFSWYSLNRNSIILLYGVSAVILAINAGFTLFFVSDRLVATFPSDIFPRTFGSALTPNTSWVKVANYGYFISSIMSFLITWASTALLLKYYSHRLGRVRYWAIIATPLVYFLSQFFVLVLNAFGPLTQADPTQVYLVVTLLFTLSKPIGGILFGIAFWIMARSIGRDKVARNFLIISAYGFILLFTSNQAIVLISGPYPPFGVATISFVGLSSYLILVGIYYSAISVSFDIGLRKSIRKSVQEHSRFLHGIGRAQLDEGIQEAVIKATKEYSDKLVQQTGVEPTLTISDMKQYLNEVLQEITPDKNGHSK